MLTKLKLIFIATTAVLAVGFVVFFIAYFKKSPDNKSKDLKNKVTYNTNCHTKAVPDLKTDNITYTLPDCASKLRISFPYTEDEIFNGGNLVGYGVHAGGHLEGLDHEWISIKSGSKVKSWADGIVTKVEPAGDPGEIHIYIDYGQGLSGVHMEVEKSYVKVGDKVKTGQEIAEGINKGPNTPASAEYALIDTNRDDGSIDFLMQPATASPFDYLKEPDKTNLINWYKKHILNVNFKKEGWFGFNYQPFLTNQLFLHEGNKGKLSGEWYKLNENNKLDYNDILTFIELKNKFNSNSYVFSSNDNKGAKEHTLEGVIEIDYSKNRFKVMQGNPYWGSPVDDIGQVYFGIFEIDENKDRPTLKIEFQKEEYPKEFSSRALNYILRSNLQRRMEGQF